MINTRSRSTASQAAAPIRRSSITASQLIGWSGLINIVAGIFYALETFLHPPRSFANLPVMMQSMVLSVPWNIVHTFAIVAFVAGLFGLIGLYARQLRQAGWLGLIGFILSFLGTALAIGVVVPDAYIFPLLARMPTTAWMLAVPGPFLPYTDLGRYFAFSTLAIILGNTLFCIAGMRARMLPRWGWLCLLIGVPLLTVGPLAANSFGLIGAALVAIGNIWLGYALWKNPGEAATAIQATR
jgi:hypothetical protein